MKMMRVTTVALLLVGVIVAKTTSTPSTVTKITPSKGGRGGGIRLTVIGTGFSPDQYNFGVGNEDKGNKVTLVNSENSQDSADCEIHKDGCTETQIMCYTPSGMTANAVYMVKVKVDGTNVPDCTSSSCLFTVRESDTPTFDSITPQSGKPGDIVLTMHGRIFTTRFGSNTKTSSNGVDKKILRVFGPQNCNLFQSTDVFYQLELDAPDSSYGTIQCKPEGSFVGNANPTVLIEQPYGRTIPDMDLYRISRTGVIHTVQYYTEIQSLSPQEGSLLGGVNIVINGDYFETAGNKSTYAAAEVFIGGEKCNIVNVQKDESITCTVPAQLETPPSFYCGGRGALLQSFDSTFTNYDDAFAMTDAADSVIWLDEMRYCGNITNTLTRLIAVFHVPFDGDYQFFIKANEHGKLVVEIDGNEIGIESTGNWAATGVSSFTKGDLIKMVAVGKPGTNSDSCVDIKAHHKNTTFTSMDTGKAFSEIQAIRLTSKVEYQNYTLAFSNFESGTSTSEKQTLCLTGGSSKYQLGLYGVFTTVVNDVSVVSQVKTALDKLPFLTSGEDFTVEVNADDQACIDITFNSPRGDIPMIETKPDTGVTVSQTIQGLSNNLDFAFMFNGVPSPLITYDSSDKPGFAGKIKDALNGIFSVQCPAMFKTGGNVRESYEDGPETHGNKVTAEVEAFCGRYSCKNCYPLYQTTGIPLIHKWLCFAVRGHDNNMTFLKFKDRDDNIKQGWFNVITNIVQTGDWAYQCVNMKQEFETRWKTVLSTAYQLIEVRIFNNEGDYYVDDIFFGQTKAIGSLTDIDHLRLGPASPHPTMHATIDWVTVDYNDTNDQYSVSIAPFDCLYDFDLLTLAGSNINGDYSPSSSSVSSTLKTGISSPGTMTVTVTSKASKPIQGTINVSYNGNPSGDIDVEKEDQDFKDILEGISNIGTLSVKRTATSTCASMEIDVEFSDTPGNMDKMTITSTFTSDNNAQAEIMEKRDGYLALEPLAGDMVCTYHTTPQVQVNINDIPTKCAMANSECGFTYSSDLTPAITGIDYNTGNQNDVRKITGTMFSTTLDENTVTIGDIPCDVTSATSTEIVCTVGNGPLGSYPVVVTVVGKGTAAGTIEFTYTAEVTGINPDTSTLGGQTLLTVSGKGLSEDSVVYFGNEECVKTNADIPTAIYCNVPAYPDPSVTADQPVSVSVKTADVVLAQTFSFTYTFVAGKITNVITTGDLTVHGGQNVTIQGTDMGNDGEVFIGATKLDVISRSSTEISAVTPTQMPPGKGLKLLIFYGTLGAIVKSDGIPTVDVVLEVTNVYPTKGSKYGGTPLTITGAGFGDSNSDVKVTVGKYACDVTQVTNTEIKCSIEDTADTHEVNNQGTQGLGAPNAFDPKSLTVQQGDSIRWSWFTPEFVKGTHGVAETDSLTSLEDKSNGISSGPRTREAQAVNSTPPMIEPVIFSEIWRSFKEKMTKLGTSYFWSGYVTDSVYYRMTVEVIERAGTKEAVTVLVAGQEAYTDLSSGQSDPVDSSGCTMANSGTESCVPETIADSDTTKFNFHFTKCHSPVVDSTAFTAAVSSIERSALSTTVLTFSGSGFSTADCANIAKIGDCPCTVSLATETTFKCTPADNCQYDIGVYKPLTLTVNQFGNALINIQTAIDRSVLFLPLIQSVSPTSGSAQGGTRVYITGKGFTDNLDKVMVTFGDIAATCSESSQISLTCTSPYKSVAGSVTIAVRIGGVTAVCESDCSFAYNTSVTPRVTSVSPVKLSTTTTLTVNGEQFGTDHTKLSIRVGGQTCSDIAVEKDNVQISCSITALPAGENDIELVIDGIGKASSDANVNVMGEAVITLVTPTTGSLHGHTLLKFIGHGFVEGLSIQVDGENICEAIAVNSLTEVECVTLAHVAVATKMVVTSNDITYDGIDYEFSEAATPNVTSVDPATGAVGDTVTIQGLNFGIEASDITVFIGEIECTGVSLSNSEITCTTGPQSSGAFDVIVDVSGKGKSQSDVPFTYAVTVTSFQPSSGDELGNEVLTVIGSGLGESHVVTVCDEECKFDSLPSTSEFKCITPPGTDLCNVKVIDGGNTITATSQFEYVADTAPFVEKVSPTRGGTGGNTEVTITGLRFSETMSGITITIDGVPCIVSFSSTTQIVCRTGAHSGSKLSEVVVIVNDRRATADDKSVLTYNYVDVWSSTSTWGGLAPPIKDDFVVIPENQVILLDTDTDVLEMLLIQGQLIFDEIDLILKAKRILITSGGKLQIGSKDKPFPANKKAIIELYGHHRDEELPIYGTKVLAVRNGTLDLFGATIDNTWTKLAETAVIGATTITVEDSINDWKNGDEIFISTTGSKDSTNENEKRTITAINVSDKTITLDKALEYEHLGNRETYSGPNDEDVNLDFKAEVGLLSRNIVVRGNSDEAFEADIVPCEKGFDSGEFVTQTCFEGRFGEEKGSSQFGAQIMIHGSVKDTQEAQAHFSYVEVAFAGQAFRLGRYPIHFHLNGDMSQSYVSGCSIHRTFNRAINIHGSHNTLIEKNVVYDVMGGAIFLEDGIETGNIFQYNLGTFVKSSTSLLNDDITPATFWITNPDNIYENNYASGGSHFGFWYRMHEHPDGPSFTDTVCPRRVPIRKFQHNVAHSFGWFGLWMFAEYYPAEDGLCNPVAAAPAVIEDFTSWNNQKGIELVDYGAIQVIRGLYVQNVLAGFEGKRTLNAPKRDNKLSPTVNDTLIVGKAISESNQNSKGVTQAGFIWPYGDEMQMHNVKFFNFDSSTVAIKYTQIDGTCSDQCGGYSNQVSRLQFLNTPNRIHFRWEHEGVIEDLDGSLCGTGQKQSVLPVTGTGTSVPNICTTICSAYVFPGGLDAAVCPPDTKFHRFSFNNPLPSSLAGKIFTVTNSYGSSPSQFMTHRLTHKDGWTVVLADGETSIFTFENSEEMTNISYTGTFGDFEENDCVIFKMKLAEKPDEVSIDDGSTTFDESLDVFTCATSDLKTGNWSYSNGYVSVAIVGPSATGPDTSEHNVHFRALKCLFPKCEKPEDPETAEPPTQRPNPYQLWNEDIWEHDSSLNSMTASKFDKSGTQPLTTEGINVTIERGMWVLYKKDMNAKLKLGTLIIKGGLEIDYEGLSTFELEANFIIILGGRFHAGWKDNPMMGTVNIRLAGTRTSPLFTELAGYDIGNKAIGVFGALELHGRDVGSSWARLKTTVFAGDKVLTVGDGTNISKWRIDDKVLITSSSSNPDETEEGIIEELDSNAGTITLKTALQSRHTGGSETVDGKDINLGAAIGLLTRSIKVEGELVDGEAHGGRILTSISVDGQDLRTGYTRVIDVLFTNMGQDGYTEDYDPRFALAFVDTGEVTDIKPSEVTRCAFVETYNTAVGVIGLSDLAIRDNVVYKPLGNGILTTSDNTELDGNLVVRQLFTGVFGDRYEAENFKFQSGIDGIRARKLTLKGNMVTSSERLGFRVPGEECDAETSSYSNNVAAGNIYGVAVMPYDDLGVAGITSCSRLSGFTVFKNKDYGIYYNNEKSSILSGNNYVDENVALFPMVVGPDPLSHTCGDKTVEVSDSVLVGTSSLTDCSAETEPSGKYITHNSINLRSKRGPHSERLGILFPAFTGGTNNCGEKSCSSIMSYNAICGKMTITGVTFKSFNGEQSGCKAAFAVSTMQGNDDLAHPIRASGNKMFNVDPAFKVLIHRPNVALVNPADCVDMDCDAKKKAIFKDEDGSFMGEPGTVISESEFEWGGDPRRGLSDARVPKDLLTDLDGNVLKVEDIATNGKGIIRTPACVKKSMSQGGSAHYWCPALQYEMLLIENLDDDTETRRLSPVAILSGGYIDLINGPQDHGWCNGYTCQKRISTFHAVVLPDWSVTVYFTSTQPDEMRFALLDAENTCVVVSVYYLNPNRIDVYIGRNYILPKNADKAKWDATKDFVLKNEDGVDYKPTCDEPNGSNFIDRNARIIYFTVKGGKGIDNAVELKRADVVIVSFGLPAMTEEEFFQDDTIIQNLANLLGIPLNKVRVVKVIAATRKRRSTDDQTTVVLEIGDNPTDTFEESSEPVTDIASTLMNTCQEGLIGATLGVSGASCGNLIYDETTYVPLPPDELWFYENASPQHEGVPFSGQPKIRAYDTNGHIIEHLGIEESPWELTATLRSCNPACGHANAELTGTLTVSSSNGWFNFTDLQISHKGDGYIIDFEVTSPTGTNLTLETAPFSVDGLPMTAGVYSMTSGDIPQDSTFTLTLDLRDRSTDVPIPDITWRGHTSFDATCGLVASSDTGNLTGYLSKTFDSATGRAAFDDLVFSGYGLIYISCLVVSTPAEYEFYSLHKVVVLSSHQASIPLEASNIVAVRYNLDYHSTLPTEVAEAQLEQATIAVFTSKFHKAVVIRVSTISEGSIIVTFTIEGESYNVSKTTEDICDDLSSGMKVTVGSTTLTLDGYMTVDGLDYYSTCGKSDDDSEGLHPAIIVLIVIVCLLVLGIIIFVLVWKFKIRPKSKTHGAKGEDSNNTNRYPGGFYYIDNGRTVFLAAPNPKMQAVLSGDGTTQALSKPPVTTLYDETFGAFSIRKSPLPPGQEAVPRGLTPTGD